MKLYRVKSEYVNEWGTDTQWFDDGNIVTEQEIYQLSNGWGVDVSELMQQVEEI